MKAFTAHLQRTMSSNSVIGYIGDVRRFTDWFQKEQDEAPDPRTVTYIDVAAYRQHLLDRGLSAATVNRALNAIQQWMYFVNNDDANHIQRVRQSRRLAPRSLKRNEFSALLRAARRGRHPERNLAIVHLMAQAGLRVGEVAALRLADLELGERKGHVRVVGKRMKERVVSLNRTARKALNNWLKKRGEGQATEPVFTSQKGGALAVRSVQSIVGGLMQEAGGIGGSSHSLRHTFAINYLEANQGDLAGLAHLLGHESLGTTLIYLQPTRDELTKRVERLAIAG